MNIAIRTGIKKLLSIGEGNILIIDEGLSTLDSDNVELLNNLFSYIKTQYEHTLIVSHVPAVSQFYQSRLTIKQRIINKGTSYIIHENDVVIPESMISCSEINLNGNNKNKNKKNNIKNNKRIINVQTKDQQIQNNKIANDDKILEICSNNDEEKSINTSDNSKENSNKLNVKRGRKPKNVPSVITSLEDDNVKNVLMKEKFVKYKNI